MFFCLPALLAHLCCADTHLLFCLQLPATGHRRNQQAALDGDVGKPAQGEPGAALHCVAAALEEYIDRLRTLREPASTAVLIAMPPSRLHGLRTMGPDQRKTLTQLEPTAAKFWPRRGLISKVVE